VNLKTGKPALRAGYAPRTINHALTVICGYYSFHSHFGDGPVLNPVPVSAERRRALAHRSPLEPVPVVRRARLRQKVPAQAPRAIPDHRWDELFAEMSCDRDRALLEFYVSSGARAGELLGIGLEDIDWPGQLVYVISKGTRERQPVPASPDAFRYLGRYLAGDGLPAPGQPVWRTRRGQQRPLTYWAMRRILQRANDKLGTNWTLHDARHTAAARMAGDERLSWPRSRRSCGTRTWAPFRIRAGTDIMTAEYADGCVVTMPTRALEFGYPLRTRSVGVHFKPWGLAPFLPMPAAELCDRPVTVEQVWGRPAIAELRDRLATADGPHEMLTLLEEELMRRLCETAGLGLVRHTSSVIAATSGAVAIGDLSVAAGVSSTHLDTLIWGHPKAEEGARGQSSHVQLGIGRRLYRGRERPARTAVRLVAQR
jgi:hypothetical protein